MIESKSKHGRNKCGSNLDIHWVLEIAYHINPIKCRGGGGWGWGALHFMKGAVLYRA